MSAPEDRFACQGRLPTPVLNTSLRGTYIYVLNTVRVNFGYCACGYCAPILAPIMHYSRGLPVVFFFGYGWIGSRNSVDEIVGVVVWTVIEKGRGKEGCAIMVSSRVWESVDGHGWIGSRIV